MDVSVENTSTLGRKLKVALPAEEISAKVDGKIREMGGQIRLKGFRPGKVPFSVLQQRFGRQVRQEVLGEMIQNSYQEALSKEKLRPVSNPEIVMDDEGETVEYTAEFQVYPELEALNLDNLKVERPESEVKDEDIDNMITTLREQRRRWEDTEDAAKDSHLVFFHYRVELEDGAHPEEGESRAGAILGHDAFDAAFEKELHGLKAGEEKSFDVTFGDSARETALAGKGGKAHVRVEKVQTPNLPAVDEEFIKSFGVESGEEAEFREEVRQNLERELKDAISRRQRQAVIGALIENYKDLEIPTGMVEREMEAMRQQTASRIEQAGGDPSKAPEAETFRESAERRVRGALLIAEVARHAELEVDMGRVRDRVNEVASTYEDPQAVVSMYYNNQQMLESVQNLVVEEQAVEWVLDNAKVKPVKKSFAEVMNPENEQAAA